MASRAYCSTCGASNPHNRSSCLVCSMKIAPIKNNPAYDSLSDTREKAVVFDLNNTLLNTSERHRAAIRAGLEDKSGKAVKKRNIEPMRKAEDRLNDFLHQDKMLAKDTVMTGGKTLVDHFASDGYTIIYCTNRPAKYFEATRRQLENKGFPVYNDSAGDPLIVLRSGNKSKPEYKRDVFVSLKAKYDVLYVFDDSHKVLNEAARLGIPGLYSSVKAYLDIIKPSSVKKNPIEIDHRSGKAFSTLEDPEEALAELEAYYDSNENPPPKPRKKNGRQEPSKIYQQRMAWSNKKLREEFPDDKQRVAVSLSLVEKFYGKAARDRLTAKWNPDEDDEDPSIDGTKFGLIPGDVEQHREFMDTAVIDPSFREIVGKLADDEDQTYYISRRDTEGKTGIRISNELPDPDSEDSGTLIDVVEPGEYSHLDKFREEHNPPKDLLPIYSGEPKKQFKNLGIVTSQVQVGRNIFMDIGEGIQDIYRSLIGGRQSMTEKRMTMAVAVMEKELSEQATALGGNALANLKVDYEFPTYQGRSVDITLLATADAIKMRSPSKVKKNPTDSCKVMINLKNKTQWAKARKVRTALGKKGITFDSDIGPGGGDNYPKLFTWYLDWSLKGGTAKQVIAQLKKAKIPHTVEQIKTNPANPSKVEKGKKLYKHMNKTEPEKIETKQIDIGDVWYQVGEGGCWQIGYMSGKETNKKDQKYTHIFNEETKDGNFPKLYATIPDKGKPMLIITGGTWKIKTDDTNTAWIYD